MRKRATQIPTSAAHRGELRRHAAEVERIRRANRRRLRRMVLSDFG